MTGHITPVKQTNCLNCGQILDAIGGFGHNDEPEPGAPVACIKCGAVMAWEAGELRPFTDAEAAELAAEAGTMAELRRLVKRIRIIRAGVN